MSSKLDTIETLEQALLSLNNFLAGLGEVCFRKPRPTDDRVALSPESQRIQDMWHSGDYDGYNAAVTQNLRNRGLAPNGQPLRPAMSPTRGGSSVTPLSR